MDGEKEEVGFWFATSTSCDEANPRVSARNEHHLGFDDHGGKIWGWMLRGLRVLISFVHEKLIV